MERIAGKNGQVIGESIDETVATTNNSKVQNKID